MGKEKKKSKAKNPWTQNDKFFLVALIPILALFFCFNTLPLLKGFYYGLTNFKGYGSYDFVGLRNFKELFTDSRVGKSYLFTFKYAIVMTILVNLISLILALGLNANIKGKSALRGIYFVPNILGGLVVGYIFSFIIGKGNVDIYSVLVLVYEFIDVFAVAIYTGYVVEGIG
jgi:raffinose/stachyose/melibiose transport system permease protein